MHEFDCVSVCLSACNQFVYPQVYEVTAQTSHQLCVHILSVAAPLFLDHAQISCKLGIRP